MVGSEKFIIVSYATKKSGYEKEIQKLIKSLERLKLPYDIELIDSQGNWYDNTLYKGEFIKKMLCKHKKAIVWVDADSIFHRYPDLFDNIEADVAMPIVDWSKYKTNRPVKEWISSTLYFANTKNAHMIINEWIKINDTVRPSYDQLNLRKVIEENLNKIFFIRLPDEYNKIFDAMTVLENPVIEAYQVSRKYKKEMRLILERDYTKIYETNDKNILKELIPDKYCSLKLFRESYSNYCNIKNKNKLVKIYKFWIENNKAYILMENLKDYKHITTFKGDKKPILLQIIQIISDIVNEGYIDFDLDISNFLINKQGDIKLIDLDKIIEIKELHNFYAEWFTTRMIRLFEWYNEN